jgi:hypothetical protein
MQNALELDDPAVDSEQPTLSIRDVAAYLRGVADATAALSEPALPVVRPHVVIKPPRSAGSTRDTFFEIDEASPMSRRTMPYEGVDAAPTSRQTMAYPAPGAPTDVAPEDSGIHDSWEEDLVTEERQSSVRLRVGKLSPEWYALLGTRVG